MDTNRERTARVKARLKTKSRVKARVRNDILESDKIILTIEKLYLRIQDRFPDSGLLGVAHSLLEIAQESDRIIRWIEKPNYFFRIISILIIISLVGGLALAMSRFGFKEDFVFSDFVTLTEAAINEIILLGAGIIFIVTYEIRQKRKRVIAALNQLRSIAHVIDAHQLTKDPDAFSQGSQATAHSPERVFTPFQLSRYLDYCSEMLALTSKVAFLYVQKFNDPVAESAVNDLENLTLGLSSKIWQKIHMLRSTQ